MWQLKKVASCVALIILFELVQLFLKVKLADAPYYYFFDNLLTCYQILALLFCISTLVTDEVFFKRFFKTRYKILSVVFFLFLAVACESICVWLMYHPKSISKGLSTFRRYYREFDKTLMQVDKRYSEYDSSLFYKLKPREQFVYTNREFSDTFRTNSQGFRDDEPSLTDPAILVLGDSYTLGWGTEQDDTYSSVVERITGLKALNTGIASYGTARESIALSSLDTSNVEFIIWQYCNNDAPENKTYVDNKFVLPIRSREQYDKHAEQANWTATYFPGKYFLTLLNLFRKEFNREPSSVPAEKARIIREGQEEAARFLAILERSKINWDQTKVIILELYYRESVSQFIPALQKLITEDTGKRDFLKNLVVLNVKPLFGEEDYYILDIHLTKQGHLKLGNHLAEVIKRLQQK